MIEVYPALAKVKGKNEGYPAIQSLLPPNMTAGTDESDAAICALHALAFALSGCSESLPPLVWPDETATDVARHEGWIYYFAAPPLRR